MSNNQSDISSVDKKSVQKVFPDLCKKKQAAEVTFEEWGPLWLRIRSASLRPSTLNRYQQEMSRSILPFCGKKPLSSFTEEDFWSYKAFLKQRNYAPASIKEALSVLSSSLTDACSIHLISSAVLPPAGGPVRSSVRPGILSEEQLCILSGKLEKSPMKHLFMIMLLCALRCGEALGLCWQDIDLKNKTMTIRRQLISYNEKGHTKYVLVPYTKTGAERQIPLSEMAAAHLQAQLQSARVHAKEDGFCRLTPPDRPVHADELEPWLLVFTDSLGRKLPYYKVHRRFQKIIKETAPDSGFSLHTLRHTAASIALSETGDIHTVQALLGHQSIRSTMRYTHPVSGAVQNMAKEIDRYYRSSFRHAESGD